MLNVLPDVIKDKLVDFQDAAARGRKSQQCGQVFNNCEFSVKETFLKYAASAAGSEEHKPEVHNQVDDPQPIVK